MSNDFFWAFLVGGAICVIGQLMFDVAKLTPAHTMGTLVVAGAIVDGLGWYEPLIKFAGAGATVRSRASAMRLCMALYRAAERWLDRGHYRNIQGDKRGHIRSDHFLLLGCASRQAERITSRKLEDPCGILQFFLLDMTAIRSVVFFVK